MVMISVNIDTEVDVDIDEDQILDKIDISYIEKYLKTQGKLNETNYHQGVIFSELLVDVERELRSIGKLDLCNRVDDLRDFLIENGE